MTQFQKIIKYLALALAFSLIFGILSLIMYGFTMISNIFDDDIDYEKGEVNNISNTSILDIEVNSSNIIFKEGNSLSVETNNDDIEVKEYNNKLFITEKKHNWFSKNSDSDLIIYVPSNFLFDDVSIESGAGIVDIQKLTTKKLDFELGAGKVDVYNLSVLDNASIDGGAGKLSISHSSIHNLELDMGVGELYLHSELTGTSDIDAGIGKVTLNLLGSNYKLKVDKGLGTSTINGENVKDSNYYGSGSHIVNIDGGIGSINISYGI